MNVMKNGQEERERERMREDRGAVVAVVRPLVVK
jgi:hypothetical protein